MRSKLAALITAAVLAFLALPAAATATVECEFVLGFASLKALIDAAEGPAKVGDCLEQQRFNPENGDALQQTTGGLLVWRKADNWTAFTDGYRTWLNGPHGLQARLNTEQFDWELAAAERAALVALYDATGGASWTDRTNWLSDAPLNRWYGVETDRNGRVTHLNLFDNNLSGPLPASWGNLTNLTQLHLSDNSLTGPLPASWGNLTNLTQLHLDRNSLTGPLPASWGNLTNLTHLHLSRNSLTGPLPAFLGTLTNLTQLSLVGNSLTGPLPATWGTLTNLTELGLEGNSLTGPLPATWGTLTKLERLYLQMNSLTGPLPASWGNLTNLTTLYLYDNNLTGCVPAGLRDVQHNDYDRLGLPFCGT